MQLFPIFAALCIGVLELYRQRRVWHSPMAILAEGDEDIKIATGHFSAPREDAADLAAQDFLRQKQSGNVDRARDLGSAFANAVLLPEQGPLSREVEGKSPLMRHHINLLYSYVVNQVIADHSPHSILAQTSLNVFYSDIESASPELYRQISDMAALSLYILCGRSKDFSEEKIGRVFAGLVDTEDNSELAEYGNTLYDKLYEACIEQIRAIPYEDA